jgi:hypothetical protein
MIGTTKAKRKQNKKTLPLYTEGLFKNNGYAGDWRIPFADLLRHLSVKGMLFWSPKIKVKGEQLYNPSWGRWPYIY